MIKTAVKRRGFHEWLCDRFGVVSLDEYLDDMNLILESFREVETKLNQQDKGWFWQDRFNRYVGEKLGLDPKDQKGKQKKYTELSDKEKDIYQ